MAATALVPSAAHAQLVSPTDSVLLRPVLDGDPKKPPRFQRRANGVAAQSADETAILGTDAGSGAGITGFISTSNGKSKKGQKASATGANASAAPINAPDAPAVLVKVKPTGAARLPQSKTRPGAPARTLLPPIATDPNLAPELLPTPLSPPTPPPGQLPIPQSPSVTPLPDDHPFAPVGIHAGAFRLRPALEVTGGFDSNPSRSSPSTGPTTAASTTPTGGSAMYVVAPELLVNSTWSRHELTATLRSSFTGFERFSSLNRPNVDAKVDGRIDVTSLTNILLEGRYLLYTDYPGSPNVQAGLARFPLATTLGTTVGVDQRFNRFEVILKGLADRTTYQASTFTDGETESNNDRNFNRFEAQLRTSYELTPGIKPFAEFDADTRVHDLPEDRSGFHRDSVGRSARIGSSFELSRVAIGEASIGYLTRDYKDPTLPNLSGVLVNSSLSWLATALTTVKFTANTSASETTLAGVSGILSRDLGIEIDHEFRRWLVGTARFTRGLDVYDGLPRRDVRYLASAALTYMLTREWQLKAEVRREWRTSNVPGSGYVANIGLIGVRLQR
jgi:hypothetical protein